METYQNVNNVTYQKRCQEVENPARIMKENTCELNI